MVDHPLRSEQTESIVTITLDRPHELNAITLEMLEALEATIEGLDDNVRCVRIQGAGEQAFSAGADISMFQDVTAAEGTEIARKGQTAFEAVASLETPVVAGIDGYCLGGGFELALAADFRIATTDSTFGLPEHRLGLLPGWGGTQRLRALLGPARTKEFIFFDERPGAQALADTGVVTEAVEPSSFESVLEERCETLAAGPPIAQAGTKRSIAAAGREDGFETEATAFGQAVASEDADRGLAAFREETTPTFEGE